MEDNTKTAAEETAAAANTAEEALADGEQISGLDAFDTNAPSEEGRVMEARNPAGTEILRWPDGRPYTITLYGVDSKRVVDEARKQADRRTTFMSRSRQTVSSSVVEKDNVELLVVSTKSWDIALSNGKSAKNDAKEFRAAYQKYRWLYDQANEFMGNRGNFMKTKPSS